MRRLLAQLAGPSGPAWVALIALALGLPSVVMPPVLDDHGFRRRLLIEQRGPDAAFDFAHEPGWLARRGPWWFDPAPERRFFRPLTGLTHWLDYRLWPDAAWWMRAESCLIYALLALTAAYAYVRLCSPGRAAAIAGLMFAVDEAHAQSLSFIAGRNTFLCAAFALWALLAHHDRTSAPGRGRAWLGPLLFALSLLAGEGGLAALAYLAAYAICVDGRPAAVRARSLLPYAAICVPWAIAYVHGGYGVGDGRFYRDPVGDPWGTLASGIGDLPVWLASQLTLGFATPSNELPSSLVRLASCAILLPVVWLVWPALRARAVARFFALGALLSLVPLMLTVPQDRLLVMTSFGAFGLLGCALESAARSARPARAARVALLAIHLGLAPLAFIPSYLLTGRIARAEAKVETALPHGAGSAETGVVIVRAPIIGSLGFGLSRRGGLGEPLPRYSYELYSAASAVSVSRLDARTLELVADGGYCQSRAECVGTRLPEGFHVGQTIAMSDMQVEIRELTRRGTPRRVRFTFASALEDPARRWLTWTRDGVQPFSLPAVHETLELPALSALDAFR